MTAASPAPSDAIRLLAGWIAADLRDGAPVLAQPTSALRPPERRPGRPKSVPYAVASSSLAFAA
jgi:hypothetical protein